MRNIIRYSNRKLYDKHLRRYVTLEDISALIREGEGVRVIDNATKKDITSVILTEIILKGEKRREGFLPKDLLVEVIKHGEAFHHRFVRSARKGIAWLDKTVVAGIRDAVMHLPSRDEIEDLRRKIHSLEEKLVELERVSRMRRRSQL